MTTSSLSAEIVSTGTEILLGDIVDTNAAWIAQQLREIGVNLYYKTAVGDNEERIRGVLEMALRRSDVIIVTGGLGPTADDVTRDAIANATGCPLVRDEGVIEALRQRFSRWGSTMTANNERQAYVPEGCTIISNGQGTAPGFVALDRRNGRGGYVIALPGVPREMKQMLEESVLPFLLSLQDEGAVIRRRILRTIGIGESTIDHQIADLMAEGNPSVGLAAKTGQVDVRIAARAANAAAAESLIDGMELKVRERIGDWIYSSVADEPVEAVVANLLADQDQTVALLESTSAGRLAERLRAVLPDLERLRAAWTLGESTPAELAAATASLTVSEASATALAREVRHSAGVDLAVVVLSTDEAGESFYAEETGESWIALSLAADGGDDIAASSRYPFGGRDELTILRLGNRVFDMVRRQLMGRDQAV